VKIEDDRGVRHDGGKKFVRSALAIRDVDRMRMVEKRIEQKSKKSTVVSETVCMLLLSVPFLGVGGVLVFNLSSVRSLPTLIFIAMIAVLGVMILFAALTRPKTIRRELAKLNRELEVFRNQFLGTCRVCEYDLGGLLPESDGCVVCPECGGAWRIQPGCD